MSIPLTEPITGQPADLPIYAEGTGNPPPRVKVHTELGVDIWFTPSSAQFSAQVGEPVQGRGTTAELHSADFAMLVERIRQRALVVPVQGYLVTAIDPSHDSDQELVSVRPCTVIEYHPRRQQPFVVRLTELAPAGRWDRTGAPQKWVTRVRTVREVLLPQPHHIEAVKAAQQAVLDEEQRHETARELAYTGVRAALDAIPRLGPADLKSVQESRQQVAQEPADLGVASYILVDDDEKENADD